MHQKHHCSHFHTTKLGKKDIRRESSINYSFFLSHIFETTRPQNKDQLCQNSRAYKIFPFIISWKLHYFLIIKNTIRFGALREKEFIYLYHLDFRQFQAFYGILYGLNSGSKLDRIKQSSRIFMDASQFFSCRSTKKFSNSLLMIDLTLWFTLLQMYYKS